MTPPVPTPPAPASRHLARSAGVIGAATMTSRVLGLVREQVLAYWFGAGDAMDAFLVAFRVPNLLRDLFAEGAMSAALVPTFSKALATEGRERAWQLGNSVLNALILVTGGAGGRRHRLRRAAGAPARRRLHRGAGQVRADRAADPHRRAVPAAGGAGRRLHGDAQLPQRVLRPGAVAGDVQRRLDRRHRRPGAGASRGRLRTGAGGGDRRAGRRPRPGAAAVAGAARPTASATGRRSTCAIPGWRAS